MNDRTNDLLELLAAEALNKEIKALFTLKSYARQLCAVGEHSTEDLYADINAAYKMYLESQDEIEGVKKLEKSLSK